MPQTIKNRKQSFSNLHCFQFPLGNWPQSTGGGEIRYSRTRNLKTDAKNLAASSGEVQLTPDKWHQVRIKVGEDHIVHSLDGKIINELYDVRAAVG